MYNQITKIYSLLFTLEVPFDFSRILRRVKSGTLIPKGRKESGIMGFLM